VITGDITQIDRSRRSVRVDSLHRRADGVEGCRSRPSKDVVRHPLVQRIVEATRATTTLLRRDPSGTLR
jgi:phosphate starvation-inducible protein PhoH